MNCICATYPNTKVNKNLEKNLLILSTKYCCVYYIFFCSYATIADLQQAFFVDFSHPLTTCSLGSSSHFPEIRSKLPCHTSVMYGLLKYIQKKAVSDGSNNQYNRLGVKVRNMKMDFNTGGTWRWVRQ